MDTSWIPYGYLIDTSVLRQGYVMDTLSEAMTRLLQSTYDFLKKYKIDGW